MPVWFSGKVVGLCPDLYLSAVFRLRIMLKMLD
jgi:hypothetical protein